MQHAVSGSSSLAARNFSDLVVAELCCTSSFAENGSASPNLVDALHESLEPITAGNQARASGCNQADEPSRDVQEFNYDTMENGCVPAKAAMCGNIKLEVASSANLLFACDASGADRSHQSQL